MTDKQTPPDWVLIEAAKRSAFHEVPFTTLQSAYSAKSAYRALCDMIERYEQPPVDRKLLCAREAIAREEGVGTAVQAQWRNGENDYTPGIKWAVRAIELWEEGFGK